MKKILIFLMLIFPFSVYAKKVPVLTEDEFLSCFNLAKDIKNLKDTIEEEKRKVNKIIREADNMEERLDDLEFNLNMSETTYQICVSNGWECSAAYNTYYYNWQRYNNKANESERLYDKEERVIANYNRKIAKEQRWVQKLRTCEKVKVQRGILKKHCNDNRSNYFCMLWKY